MNIQNINQILANHTPLCGEDKNFKNVSGSSSEGEEMKIDFDDEEFVKEIGAFRILNKVVGNGAFSTILEAVNVEEPEKLFAVKVSMKKRNLMTDLHYFNSVENLYGVQHPNIVKLHCSFETCSHYYLFLDYCSPPAVMLSEFIVAQEQGFLDVHVALVIFVQIIAGISHLHRVNIAHRDLKPDNILISPDTLAVTIIDFGFSSTEASVADQLGSPLYMSPETLSGKDHDPKISDVWSAGIILYQMLFGKHPLRSTSLDSLRNESCNSIRIPKNYPIWGFRESKSVDPIVREILHLCLQTDPEKRISSDSLEKKILREQIFYFDVR